MLGENYKANIFNQVKLGQLEIRFGVEGRRKNEYQLISKVKIWKWFHIITKCIYKHWKKYIGL